MKHARLVIILSVLTTVAFAAMIFHVLFTVRDVNAYYSVYTDEEVEKAEKVLASYKGRNLLFVSEKDVEKRITEETSLKVKSVQKIYPNAIKVELTGRQERFAIPSGDGQYYILDEEYSVVAKRKDLKNPDGLDNVLLSFDTIDKVEVEEKSNLNVTDGGIVEATAKIISSFASPRDALLSVVVTERKEEKGNVTVHVTLRDGVIIEVRKVLEKGKEKIAAGIAKYNTLSDGEKTEGRIICNEVKVGDNYEVTATYTKR